MRDIVSRLQQGLHTARERGEELAQAARMRVEVFTLGREQEALYARLGRAYHDGASSEVLEGIQGELRRVAEEIAARERILGELASDLTEDGPRPLPTVVPAAGTDASEATAAPEAIPGAQPIGEVHKEPQAQSPHQSPQGDPHGPTDGSGSWPSPSESSPSAPWDNASVRPSGDAFSADAPSADTPSTDSPSTDSPSADSPSAADLWRNKP